MDEKQLAAAAQRKAHCKQWFTTDLYSEVVFRTAFDLGAVLQAVCDA